jgi:cytoskeletal protein RodZ
MKTKIAMFAAAATLSLAGAAFAQQTTPAQAPSQAPPASTSSTTTTTTAPDPATGAQTTTSSTTTQANDAAAAGAPSSANVALDLKAGAEVKDPSGAVVGTIAGTAAGADGSTNVVVTSGEKKFALPKASFSAAADGGLQTTATKAQIDATLAGAKPQ